MTLLKRFGFFILVNILVMTTISITVQILSTFFGIQIEPSSFSGLIIFCGLFGMGGAFISLFISKWMAKMTMGVQIIDPKVSDPHLQNLVKKVHYFANEAGLSTMPEVGIYDSPEVNAFATGPSRNNSLVAVSSGLLNRMSTDEVDGVLAHEVAHVANGDMVTMTLIQGIINTFVMVFARLIAGAIAGQMDERARPMVHFGLVMVLQIALSLLGSIVVNAFSRWREYRADYGGARLAGRSKMVAALERLSRNVDLVDTEHQAMASLKISDKKASFLSALFSTHPSLDDRIKRLKSMAN
ncbi:MAG: protease HtpX [Bdellovibrionales bacterium]|nr:protease HtpX [Bdellovibrionales bacterium]